MRTGPQILRTGPQILRTGPQPAGPQRLYEISLGNLCPGPLTAPTSLAGRSAVTVILVEDGVGAVEALLLKPRRAHKQPQTHQQLLYSLYSPVDSPRRSARPPLWGEGYNYRRPRDHMHKRHRFDQSWGRWGPRLGPRPCLCEEGGVFSCRKCLGSRQL